MNRNLTTVHAIYDAFGKGDIPAILSFLAEDVAWESWAGNSAQQAGVPWLRPRRGKAGVAEFFQVVSTMQFHEFRILAFMDGGDRIAVEIEIDVTLANGNRFRDEEMHLWSFDEAGRVSGLRHYADTFKHMKAAQVLSAHTGV